MNRIFDDTNARESAIAYAKLVLPHAKTAGLDVGPMKDRMARWVSIVENYERDIRDVWANAELGDERPSLVKGMRRARTQLMDEIFGR